MKLICVLWVLRYRRVSIIEVLNTWWDGVCEMSCDQFRFFFERFQPLFTFLGAVVELFKLITNHDLESFI